MDEALASSIAVTQTELGAIIKRPKLTEALLKKPPFRFLHDIVSEVVKGTGFAEGLFTDDEQVAQNIKDKESKLAFLNKIIDCVGFAAGNALSVRPTKIVAGLEPEQTNNFLQILAGMSNDPNVDREGCVGRVLAGEKPSGAAPDKPKKKSAPPPEATPSGEAEAPPAEKPRRKKRPEQAPEGGDAAPAAEEPRRERRSRPAEGEEGGESKEERRERRRREKEAAAAKAAAAEQAGGEEGGAAAAADGLFAGEERPASKRRGRREPQPDPYGDLGDAGLEGGDAARAQPEAEAPRQMEPEAAGEDEGTEVRRSRPERPQTARRPPPRVATNVVAGKDKEKAMTGVPAEGPAASGVIQEGMLDDDDDDVIEEDDSPEGRAKKEALKNEKQHGKLVRDILGQQEKEEAAKREEEKLEGQGVILRRKGRKQDEKKQTTRDEIQNLRESIQTLTQTTNPLGRCMDYVQEDMENMAKELEKWKSEVRGQEMNMEDELRTTETSLQNLYAELAQMDDLIDEQVQNINTVKANILRNDVTIENALRMVVHAR